MSLKHFLILALSLVLMLGCTDSRLLLVNSIARFGSYTVHSDIAYGKEESQQLDIYVPDELPNEVSNATQSLLPTVVFFYGGCWGACSDLGKEDYRFIAEAITANNLIAVVVNYRKFPSVLFPDIIVDAQKSVEWISKNISRYGGNNQQLFLMGHSAGAHIASMLHFNEQYLTSSTYRNIRGFIGLAGPYDFLPFTESYQPALFSPPESYSKSQTINFVDGNEPPSLLLYGNDDTRVKRRNIISLSKAILDKNGRVETHFYDNIDHPGIVGALSIPLRSSQPIMQHISKFISENQKI